MRKGMSLYPGDRIGLVATARFVDEALVDETCATISAWGYAPVPGKHILSRQDQFAGTDAERAEDLQSFLNDREIRAILCMRGGYGTIRIMESLDFTQFMDQPKYVCGFSDVTVLLSHIQDKLGIPCVHCAMPYTFPENSHASLDTLQQLLSGKTTEISAPAHLLNITGSAEGMVIGGNLSILHSLLGTKYGFSTAGKILLLEDVDEYLYHIDRMLMSLQLAGKLQHVRGVIIGGMTDMKDNSIPFGSDAYTMIHRYVSPYNVPVAFGFPAGHQPDNRAILMGSDVTLQVTASGTTLTMHA